MVPSTAKTLARLWGCPGWPKSMLGTYAGFGMQFIGDACFVWPGSIKSKRPLPETFVAQRHPM